MLNPTPEMEHIFSRPGKDWTFEERMAVIVWLNTSPQLKYLIMLCLCHLFHYLGSLARIEDAEDIWIEFCLPGNTAGLDYVIENYDPERGPFLAFLNLRLRQYCWKESNKIRMRAAVEVPMQTLPNNQTLSTFLDIQIDIEDLNQDTEKLPKVRECLGILKDCFNSLSKRERLVLYMLAMEEKPYNVIARELTLREGNLRVITNRARGKLTKCMDDRLGRDWKYEIE